MIILSWNIRGIGAKVKKSLLRNLIKSHDPIFVFIQESKLENCSQRIISSIWNNANIGWSSSPFAGLSGGIISLWNNSLFSMVDCRIHKHWIGLSGQLRSHQFECILINIYNPCNVDRRKEVWAEIIEFHWQKKLPCLIMGDFNETLSLSDRGSQRLNNQGSADFSDFIESLALIEIPPSNGGFNWFHGASKSKLNRLFVDPEWMLKIPQLRSTLLKRSISDHCPILASSTDQNWGPRPFRFINCWFSSPSCMDTIQKSWSDSKGLEPHKRLKNLKLKLQEWSKKDFGHIETKITQLEEKIAIFDETSNSRSLSESEILERKTCQLELWRWLKNKESLWAQKSRIQWLRKGDKNTKFFHSMASIRKIKNDFSSLLLNDTNMFSPADVKNEAMSFFKKLFKEEHTTRPTFMNLEFKKLLPWQNEKLKEDITNEEIDLAVASCDSQKSPGLDGFNFLFIKKSWDIIKHDFYEIVKNFWITGSLPKGTRP